MQCVKNSRKTKTIANSKKKVNILRGNNCWQFELHFFPRLFHAYIFIHIHLFAFISGVILYRLFYNLLLSLNSIPQSPFPVMIYTSISCPLTVLYFKHSFVEKSNLINSFWKYLLRNVVCVYAIAFLVLPSMDLLKTTPFVSSCIPWQLSF